MKKNIKSMVSFLLLSQICLAQIPVSQEPRHHDLLDNEHVRLLDVHIPAGDTSAFHIHQTPSVFIVLHNVKTGSEVISEEDHRNSPIPHYDNIWFEGFYGKPRIHRVWNNDSSEFHVMDIELPNKKYRNIVSPIRQGAFVFLFDEKPVRAYRLNLNPSSDIFLPAVNTDILMILLTDSVQSVRVNEKSYHQKGDYQYVPFGLSLKFVNQSTAKAVFAFFELK
jgi:hypothetical protein